MSEKTDRETAAASLRAVLARLDSGELEAGTVYRAYLEGVVEGLTANQ